MLRNKFLTVIAMLNLLVAERSELIECFVIALLTRKILLTPEQRETVKELLAYEKEVFLDTIAKYQ